MDILKQREFKEITWIFFWKERLERDYTLIFIHFFYYFSQIIHSFYHFSQRRNYLCIISREMHNMYLFSSCIHNHFSSHNPKNQLEENIYVNENAPKDVLGITPKSFHIWRRYYVLRSACKRTLIRSDINNSDRPEHFRSQWILMRYINHMVILLFNAEPEESL